MTLDFCALVLIEPLTLVAILATQLANQASFAPRARTAARFAWAGHCITSHFFAFDAVFESIRIELVFTNTTFEHSRLANSFLFFADNTPLTSLPYKHRQS